MKRKHPDDYRHARGCPKDRSKVSGAKAHAFRANAKWNLGEYGIRRITGMFRRKFLPGCKWERVFEFGTLSKGVGLQVGELTLRKCYHPA